MPAAVAFLAAVIIFALGAAFVARRKAMARRAVAWLRARHGRDLALLSVCVLLCQRRRTAGVMALGSTFIAFRSVRFRKELTGLIELDDIGLLMWAQAERGAHPAIRWRFPGQVMSIIDKSGLQRDFLLNLNDALMWEKVLDARLQDRSEESDVEGGVLEGPVENMEIDQ